MDVGEPPRGHRRAAGDEGTRRKYAAILTLLGVAQLGCALVYGGQLIGLSFTGVGDRWVWWLLAWSGCSWAAVGLAYAWERPDVFGKRAEGGLVVWQTTLLLPYLLVTWLIWSLQRVCSREAAHHEVAPGLWLGRRCTGRELPLKTAVVVDLAAEFPERSDVRQGREYISLPVLDALAPPQDALVTLAQRLASAEGPVYLHCALGHGRSAVVAAAVILARGQAAGPGDAITLVCRSRPGAALTPTQWRRLEECAGLLSNSSDSVPAEGERRDG